MNKEYEVVKFIDNEIELDVNIDPREETIWLSLEQISKLYDRDKSVVSRHIKNIYNENELEKSSTVANFATVQNEGGRLIERNIVFYNLDVIISVGYRVKSNRGVLFRKWSNSVLKEYMLKGYVINDSRVTVTNENYLSLVESVNNINNEIVTLKSEVNVINNKLNTKDIPIEAIFYNGQVYDAFEIVERIFRKAKEEIIIIDNYVDETLLERLKCKNEGIRVLVYTKFDKMKITSVAIRNFNLQYPSLEVIDTNNAHDRFIIIDKLYLYHLGASIKDLGKKIFGINRMDKSLIDVLINKL